MAYLEAVSKMSKNIHIYLHVAASWANPAACCKPPEEELRKKKYFLWSQRIFSLTIPFSFGTAVYTGPGPVEDVFSTTNRMTVLFITNDALTKGGFKANFTTGYHLGIPGQCSPDHMLPCTFWRKAIEACRVKF